MKIQKGSIGVPGSDSVGNKLALLVGGFKFNPQNPHKRVSSGGGAYNPRDEILGAHWPQV